jgi:hypothetical protein
LLIDFPVSASHSDGISHLSDVRGSLGMLSMAVKSSAIGALQLLKIAGTKVTRENLPVGAHISAVDVRSC